MMKLVRCVLLFVLVAVVLLLRFAMFIEGTGGVFLCCLLLVLSGVLLPCCC